MKKSEVTAAVMWADELVSESQNSVQAGYEVFYPRDWRKPAGLTSVRLRDLPHPRIQRMQLVATGARAKLGLDDESEEGLLETLAIIERKEITTKTELVRLLYAMKR